jgi:hypothetical protein
VYGLRTSCGIPVALYEALSNERSLSHRGLIGGNRHKKQIDLRVAHSLLYPNSTINPNILDAPGPAQGISRKQIVVCLGLPPLYHTIKGSVVGLPSLSCCVAIVKLARTITETKRSLTTYHQPPMHVHTTNATRRNTNIKQTRVLGRQQRPVPTGQTGDWLRCFVLRGRLWATT